MWYYQNFDINFVTCRACGMPFHKKQIARKRKCPHCRLDNRGCIPTPRALDTPSAVGLRTDSKNMFVSPETKTDGSACQ